MSWPGFVNLSGLWFLLGLIPLIILYFLKLRRPRVEIPSLALWQSVVNDQRVNSPFQRFRRNLLLLLQILLLCLLVLALMQPFFAGDAAIAKYKPILIDCSASMASIADDSGKTRLDVVKDQIREQIDNLTGDQRLALFSFASTGRRLTEFTDDRRVLLKALENLKPTDLPGKLDDVLRMTAAYTRTFEIDDVTIMSDGNLPENVDFELPFEIIGKMVSSGGPNVGITEMSARRSGPEEWEVFVRVAASSEDLRGAELKFFENGQETHSEMIEVSKEEAERLVFPVASAEALLLEARVVPASFDSLKTDDSVWLSLPAARPLEVWTSPKLATWRRALSVLKNLEFQNTGDEKPKSASYDLIISDTEEIDADAPVKIFVGVIPAALSGMIELKEEIGTVVDWNRTTPLLRHVQLAEVQAGEQPAWVGTANEEAVEKLGFEVLIDGAAGPLLLQKREGLSVSYWFTFNTDKSTLPYRVSFPIIAANAVESALKQASLSEVAAAPTGVLPSLNLEAERKYVIKGPDDQSTEVTTNSAGLLTGVPGAKVGRYDVMEGSDVVASVGTGLLNSLETSLVRIEEIKPLDGTAKVEQTDKVDTDKPLWWLMALGAFLLMLFEWWYFQRARGAMV